jgi:hypothetical protein
VKKYPVFGRNRKVNSISGIWVASAIVVAVTSVWGCSSSVESVDDWRAAKFSSYAVFLSSPANISNTSASATDGSSEDDPAVMVGSGHTDPSWERAGDASFLATNNRVLEVPRVIDLHNAAATYTGPGE